MFVIVLGSSFIAEMLQSVLITETSLATFTTSSTPFGTDH